MNLATRISTHFSNLAAHMPDLPAGVEWLNPLGENQESRAIFQIFLEKFYADEQPRQLIVGINPGRFGGGITNVAFTDPLHLEKELNIANTFPKKPNSRPILSTRSFMLTAALNVFTTAFSSLQFVLLVLSKTARTTTITMRNPWKKPPPPLSNTIWKP